MWPNPQFPADLVIFPQEILNGKLHFMCRATTQHFSNCLQLPQILENNASASFSLFATLVLKQNHIIIQITKKLSSNEMTVQNKAKKVKLWLLIRYSIKTHSKV